MRRSLRLRHLSRLRRRSLGRKGRQADADGRGHARLRLRCAADVAAVVPDQGERRTRRPRGLDAGKAGLSSTEEKEAEMSDAIKTDVLIIGAGPCGLFAVFEL